MDVFDRDLLLTLAAVAVERVEQRRIGAGKLVRLAQVFAAPLECLLKEHGAPVALHGGIVCCQWLSRDHSFELISRPDTDQRGNGRAVLLVTTLLVGMLEPKSFNGLTSENVVPVVRSRSADLFQNALQVIRMIGNDRGCFLLTASTFRSSHRQSSYCIHAETALKTAACGAG